MRFLDGIFSQSRIPDRIMDALDEKGFYDGIFSRYEVYTASVANVMAIRKINRITISCRLYSINGNLVL